MTSELPEKVIIHEFQSVQEWVNASANWPTDMPLINRVSRAAVRRIEGGELMEDFAGGASWDDAVELATVGWPQGRKAIEARTYVIDGVLRATGNAYEAESIQPTFALTGVVPNVGRYLSGRPDSMMQFLPREDTKPVIRFVISLNMSYYATPQDFLNRGAAIGAMVHALEDAGHRTEIIAYSSHKGHTRHTRLNDDDPPHQTIFVEDRVWVKHAEDVLQLDQLAFVIAHPAALRRFMFSLSETATPEDRAMLGIRGQGGFYGYFANTRMHGDIHIEGGGLGSSRRQAQFFSQTLAQLTDMNSDDADDLNRSLFDALNDHADVFNSSADDYEADEREPLPFSRSDDDEDGGDGYGDEDDDGDEDEDADEAPLCKMCGGSEYMHHDDVCEHAGIGLHLMIHSDTTGQPVVIRTPIYRCTCAEYVPDDDA